MREHWQLDRSVAFLNHGSFGATPTVVLEALRSFQDALEREPIEFLAPERDLEPKLDRVRRSVASFVGAEETDMAFVRNATDGVNAVLRSMPLRVGDEIVITDHGYNACNNVARFVAERSGAKVRVAHIPFPLEDDAEIVAAIESQFSDRTRVLLVDHVTSSTGLIFPIEKIVAMSRSRGIAVLVDGAHAPGMIPLDLNAIGADYYTANHHKWMCAPKTSGFLWVRRQLQDQVRPTVISHAANTPRPGRSKFLAEFDWIGTYDVCPLLATTSAIDFLQQLRPGGIDEHMLQLRQMTLAARKVVLETLELPDPAPAHMIGSMASIRLPDGPPPIAGKADPLQLRLREMHHIEVPVFRLTFGNARVLRLSVQSYNDMDQYRRLAKAIRDELHREKSE